MNPIKRMELIISEKSSVTETFWKGRIRLLVQAYQDELEFLKDNWRAISHWDIAPRISELKKAIKMADGVLK